VADIHALLYKLLLQDQDKHILETVVNGKSNCYAKGRAVLLTALHCIKSQVNGFLSKVRNAMVQVAPMQPLARRNRRRAGVPAINELRNRSSI
jgi:hypothetical protein